MEHHYLEPIALDFLRSDDPQVLDQGVIHSLGRVRLSILAGGLGLAKIHLQGNFKNLGYRSMWAYIENVSLRTNMDTNSIYNWMKIGEAYLKHQEDLERIGFRDEHGPSKLRLLEQALQGGEKEEVLQNLMEMSHADFTDFARQGAPKKEEEEEYFTEKGHIFYHRGLRAVIINSQLAPTMRSKLKGAIRAAFKSLRRKGHLVVVRLRNAEEAKLFIPEARRLRRAIWDKLEAEKKKPPAPKRPGV